MGLLFWLTWLFKSEYVLFLHVYLPKTFLIGNFRQYWRSGEDHRRTEICYCLLLQVLWNIYLGSGAVKHRIISRFRFCETAPYRGSGVVKYSTLSRFRICEIFYQIEVQVLWNIASRFRSCEMYYYFKSSAVQSWVRVIYTLSVRRP